MEANDSDTERAEQGLSWSDLLLAYRVERSQQAAAALIERLGPWLTNARKSLLEAPPFADEDDIAQQLVLEALARAAWWQPDCEERWIPRRLVEAAERRVRRALRRERRHQPLELDEQLPSRDEEEHLIVDTPLGSASAADLQMIFRYHVLGEPLAQMARQACITPRQMRRRIQLAKKRARA